MTKPKDLRNIGKSEREKKLKELKIELIKSRSSAQKTGSSRIREIKRTIARILTIDTEEKK